MSDYLIYGVDSKDNRTQVAHTPSARAAKTYRDRKGGPWKEIIVAGPDGDLSVAELDGLSATEDRLGKRY